MPSFWTTFKLPKYYIDGKKNPSFNFFSDSMFSSEILGLDLIPGDLGVLGLSIPKSPSSPSFLPSKASDSNRHMQISSADGDYRGSSLIRIGLSIVGLFLFGATAIVLCRTYLASFLTWLAHLQGWRGPAFFVGLFTIVSLPMTWGYIILNLGAGYIYGLLGGCAVTILGANIGSFVSFNICRVLAKDVVTRTLSTYENLKQVVRVIEGRQGWRIIMMTRLTPVPFGLQNAIFSTAKITKTRYVTATFIGLLPTVLLNTYMGTTLRSMEDVLDGKNSSSILLFAQIIIALFVSQIVNMRMKHEVNAVCDHEAAARAALLDAAMNTGPRFDRVMSMQLLPIQVIAADDSMPHRTFPFAETSQGPSSMYFTAPQSMFPFHDRDKTVRSEHESAVSSDHTGMHSSRVPIFEPTPTTPGGQFVRGHRRTQSAHAGHSSAQSPPHSKDQIIKLHSYLKTLNYSPE